MVFSLGPSLWAPVSPNETGLSSFSWQQKGISWTPHFPKYEHAPPQPLFLLEASVCAVTGQGLREMMVPLLSNGQGLGKSPRLLLYIPG